MAKFNVPARAGRFINKREWLANITELEGIDLGLSGLTEAEVKQLAKINTTSISAAQWAILGALDQALATTDDVVFNTINGLDLLKVLFGNIVSVTDDYTASYYDVLLCNGDFTITMPDITSDDLGKPITLTNKGSYTIPSDGDGNDTFYGKSKIELYPGDTLVLKPITTSEWRLF